MSLLLVAPGSKVKAGERFSILEVTQMMNKPEAESDYGITRVGVRWRWSPMGIHSA
jgi:biotin carboxyl carrier protein